MHYAHPSHSNDLTVAMCGAIPMREEMAAHLDDVTCPACRHDAAAYVAMALCEHPIENGIVTEEKEHIACLLCGVDMRKLRKEL